METIASHIRRLVAQELATNIDSIRFNSTLGQLGATSGDLARLKSEMERVFDITLNDLHPTTMVSDLNAEVLMLKKKEAA